MADPTKEAIKRKLAPFPATKPINLQGWGVGDPSVPIEQQAQDAVQLEYGQKQRALEEAQLQATQNYNRLADEERTYGQEVDPRLENIYSALGTSLQGNQQANQQTYGNAIDQIRAWYDQARSANQELNTDIMGDITGMAERLGIQAGVPAGTQQLTEDFAFNQQQLNEAQAGRSSSLAELAAQIEALDRNRVGAASREGGQQRAMLQNEIAQTLGDLGMAHYQEMGGLRSQLAGLSQDRGAAERDALSQLEQRQFENLQTGRGNALQEFLARSGLGLQQAEFGQANYEADRNFDLALQELGLSREELGLRRELGQGELALGHREASIRSQELAREHERWSREFAEATSPEAKERARAELERIKAETTALERENSGIGGNTEYGFGDLGLDQYVKTNNVDPKLVGITRYAINNARENAADPTSEDEVADYSYALDDFERRFATGMSPERAQQVRNMLAVYYLGGGG